MEERDPNVHYRLDDRAMDRTAVELCSVIQENRANLERSMTWCNLLDSLLMVGSFPLAKKSPAANNRPPNDHRILILIALLAVCSPVSQNQVLLFLSHVFPYLARCTISRERVDAVLKAEVEKGRVEQEKNTSGKMHYTIKAQRFSEIFQECRCYFSDFQNWSLLHKSILRPKLAEYFPCGVDTKFRKCK